jgi:hypothetical protein
MDAIAESLDFEGFCSHRKQSRVLQRRLCNVLACSMNQAFFSPLAYAAVPRLWSEGHCGLRTAMSRHQNLSVSRGILPDAQAVWNVQVRLV